MFAIQPDGRVLVGGLFTTLEGQIRTAIGRYQPDGTLDSEFHPVIESEAASLLPPVVYSIVIQPDERIVLGGRFSFVNGQPRIGLVRLNPDGSMDESFTPSLLSPDSDETAVYSLILQTDGRLLVNGYFSSIDGAPRTNLARLFPDGSLDLSFAPPGFYSASVLALQQDGQLLVSGNRIQGPDDTETRLHRLINTEPATESLSVHNSTITWFRVGTSPEVSRTTFEHSADGLSWTTLGTGTRFASTATEPPGWELTGVALPPGGTIRARGFLNSVTSNGADSFVETHLGAPVIITSPLGRTNNAETVATFHVIGAGTPPLFYQWHQNGMPLTNSSEVAGADSPALTLSHVLKPDEGDYTVTISNSEGSIISTPVFFHVIDPLITVQPVGGYLLRGEAFALELHAAGSDLQYQWFQDQQPVPGATNPLLTFENLEPIHAGSYFAIVSNSFGALTSSIVPLGVNAAQLDNSFNPLPNGPVTALALNRGGDLYVAGDFQSIDSLSMPFLARFNSQDQLFTNLNLVPDARIAAISPDLDGRISFGGEFLKMRGHDRPRLASITSFGALLPPLPSADNRVSALLRQPDDKLIIGGSFTTVGTTSRRYLARINPNYTVDTAFNADPNAPVTALALEPDGNILIAGSFLRVNSRSHTRMARILANGELDLTFNPAPDNTVHALTVQTDGKILVIGAFRNIAGQQRFRLARLHPNGALDASFTPPHFYHGFINSIALQADRKILLGGSFGPDVLDPRFALLRLRPSGEVDLTFGPFYDETLYGVNALLLEPDGRLTFGGDFRISDQPHQRLGRLINTGPAVNDIFYDGSKVLWTRGGTAPELLFTSFDWSPSGSGWIPVGKGVRVFEPNQPVNWEVTPTTSLLPGFIRARGYYATSGIYPSGGYLETIAPITSPSPPLSIYWDGDSLEFSWPASAAAFSLQSTHSLSQPLWSLISELPTVSGDSAILRLQPSAEQQFFRLRR